MANVLGYAGFGTAIFSLVSVIVSLALNYWVYQSYDVLTVSYKTYFGLWNYCSEPASQSEDVCRSFDDSEDSSRFNFVSPDLKVVRAMVLLALFLDVGGIVCSALKLFMMRGKKMLGYVAASLLLAAGLLLIVGFGVYVDKIFSPYKESTATYPSRNKPTLHAGFAFCIIAWLASWTSAALFGVATFQENDGE